MIEVTVKTLDGKNRAFSVPDEITVKQFKKTIAASIEIKAEIQRLIFKGRILCDDHKINDYDVNGKTIHVVQKLPPSSAAPVSSTLTTGTSTDSLSANTRDADEIGRSGRRIFLGSYSLASDGMNIVQQMLDDLGDSTVQGSRIRTQNLEEGASSSLNGTVGASSTQNRGANESQNRVNQIKKLISSAKRMLDSLESPNVDNSASLEDAEQNDSPADRSNSAEQGTSAEGSAERNTEPQDLGSSVIGDLLDEVMSINERLRPHLVLYQQLMRDDAVLQQKSQKMEEAQQLCSLVPRTLHFVSHIYHNLSDLSVDVNTPPPRLIVAPPVRRQATAIFQQSIPVLQAEISLSGGPLMHTGSLAASSTSTRTTSAQAEPSDSTVGGFGSRLFSTLNRVQVSASSNASATSSGTASYSSVFPLFLSSSVGSSILPSSLPPWLTAATSSTSNISSASSTLVTASSSSNASLNGVTSTTDSSSRGGTRRGYRRFTESSARNRPSMSISTHDIGEPSLRHLDPYLMCHSRHFRPSASAQQPGGASTSRNSNQSLSDIISGLVSSIMTTPGEAPAEVTASGRHGNNDEISTSFTTHLDSSLREFHEQLLDDPEIEEEMISTWHPLDSSSSFVRNIFGSSDRPNDGAQSTGRSFPRAATSVLEDFLNIMNSDSRSDENWLELLIRQVLSIFSFSDILSILNGNISLLSRARQPLQDFVRSTVLNGQEATDDNLNSAVEHLTDDLYYFLEEMAGDADVMREVDFVASLISFLKYHLKKIFGVIMKSTEETDLFEELLRLCHQMAIEFVCLCEGCLRNDGFVSFVQNHLFFPYGVHSAIGSWVRDQFRSFRSSVLPNPLQAIVCERHVVFDRSLNTLNDSDSSVTLDCRTKKETSEGTDGPGTSACENASLGSNAAEQNASSSQDSSPTKEQTATASDKSTRDRLHCIQKTSKSSSNDVQFDGPPSKRRKTINYDEEAGLASSSPNIQNNNDGLQSPENGSSSNNLREDDAFTSAAATGLTFNGIDDAPRTSDFEEPSNLRK